MGKQIITLISGRPKGVKNKTFRGNPLTYEVIDGYLYLPNDCIPLDDPDDNKKLLEEICARLPQHINNPSRYRVFRSDFGFDQRFKRMFRPERAALHFDPISKKSHFPEDSEGSENYREFIFQLRFFVSTLERIFSVVSPTPSNQKSYGTEIRNLLILASTEFEAQCRGVLYGNGYCKDRMNTIDYVKLLRPMKLNEISVKVSPYITLPDVFPFLNWRGGNPTTSLGWYSAYNATKHNRELHFDGATLDNAVGAVAACAAMFYAQYGDFPDADVVTKNFLHIKRKPSWLYHQRYTRGYFQRDWEEVDYIF